MKRSAFIIAGTLWAATASAQEGIRLPPVDHAATAKECGACHLVFPPQMLPARSWAKIMEVLSDHFGEDASLDQAARDDIAAYLASRAADTPDAAGGRRFLGGLGQNDVPVKITETPWWIRAHDEIGTARFASEKVKSKANCMACHRRADKGEFFEEGD
jgi:Dihaem cytochrome c